MIRTGAIHTNPDAFDDGRQMPRVYRHPVNRSLPANSFEPDTPEPSGLERMPVEQRIEARDRSSSALECVRDVREPGERTAQNPRRGTVDGWREECREFFHCLWHPRI
jgi:hypothetical protein